MPFPVAKLGYLLIRQLSKPIANVAKERAKNNAVWRRWVIMPIGHVYHGMDVRWRMRALGFGKTTKVTPISEEKAVETGAEIFGELFLYCFGVVVYIAYESYQKALKLKHESSQDSALTAIEDRMTDLALIVEEQDTKIRELTRLVHSIPATKKIVDLKSGTVLEVKQ